MTTNVTTLNSKGVDIHAASNRLIAAYEAKKQAEIAIEAAKLEIAKEEAKAKKTTKIANALIPANAIINQTYNGNTGCACGCGGDYSEDGEMSAKVTKRINVINKAYANNPLDVEIDTCSEFTIYEVITSVNENPDGFDRVTRVYVKNVK